MRDKQGNKTSLYKGTLVFVTEITPEEQRQYLAAQDLQVQVSARGTEAAGASESDAMASFAIQFAPFWEEGILGLGRCVVLDRTKPGFGDTIMPYANTERAYQDAFMWAIECYNERRHDYALYQKEAGRLSRVLEARNTSAMYLIDRDRIAAEWESINAPLEARSNDMIKTGLIVSRMGIDIERLSPEINVLDSSGVLDLHNGKVKVEAILWLVPGAEMPKVEVHTDSEISPGQSGQEEWKTYELELIEFDKTKRRAIYRLVIPSNGNRTVDDITWKINDKWLGGYEKDAHILLNISGDVEIEGSL